MQSTSFFSYRKPRARLVAAVLFCAPVSTAWAQRDGVTLFGVLNLGVLHHSHRGKTLNLVSVDGLQTSRIGFRGQETLGDGVNASFYLEGAIAPDVGAGGDWRRRATVSLASRGTAQA